ncbi:uncharacterized protein K441DRAFT_700744 [Cenococcum geophilum 1.58]|uniref:Uncharacterized protein n=1 Tax=Cenococcum geophilum 1.58 TaxID=794803 RepID=A0ACC8EP41_9PEZI|nr:hypothetical protein K441DRAFT_700744 [Cenococcum geophilum 1.58]
MTNQTTKPEWKKEHLIACRLIQHTSGNTLPVLKGFAPEPNDLKDYEDWDNIKRLVDGLPKKDLKYKSSLQLEQQNGNLGMLWSALAKCTATEETVEARKRPQRERRKTQSKDYVSSENIETSSSDSEKSHQSSHSSQESYRDNDEHTNRTKPEDVTVDLARAFIRYILNFYAGQDPRSETMLEFRGDRVRVHHNLFSLRVDATDDGGIWKVETKGLDKHPWTWKSRLALLEAKKAFRCIDDDNQPVVPDANLSQYTCEALTACLSYPDRDGAFVIAMTQTFMRFMYFHWTKDYMEYFKCTDAEKQRASKAYLHMTETAFFDLNSEVGRRHAVCNLLGLVKFWEKQWERTVQDVEGSEGDVESVYTVDEAVSGGNDDNINSDDLLEYEGDSEMNADNHNDEDDGPKVRKRKRRYS